MPDTGTPLPGTRADAHHGHTIAVPHCDKCPPLSAWPMMHLTVGTCPRCGQYDPKAWRVARARRLVAGGL